MKEPTVRYSIRLSAELNRIMEEICLRRKGLTKMEIIEAALKEYLYPEGGDKRELVFSGSWTGLSGASRELSATWRFWERAFPYVRVWLTQTKELPEEQ